MKIHKKPAIIINRENHSIIIILSRESAKSCLACQIANSFDFAMRSLLAYNWACLCTNKSLFTLETLYLLGRH